MQSSKFIDLLRQLSPRERGRFSDFVHSPFFNKHKASTRLFEYIQQFAPQFENEQLNKDVAFVQLFPNKKYSDQRMYTLLSNLLQLLYEFLGHINMEQAPQVLKKHSLEELRLREAQPHWQTILRQQEILLGQFVYQNANQWKWQYKLAKEQDAWFLALARRTADPSLQRASDSFDVYYLANKLKMACDMQSRNMVVKASYESWGLSTLLELMSYEKERFSQYPAVQVYWAILQMLQQGTDEHYYQARRLLAENRQHFQKEELKTQHDYLINYIIRQLNSSRPDWYSEFLDLHQYLLKEEIIIINDELPEWDYKNIVTVALRLKEFDWSEQFIHQYKDKVKEEVRENVYNFNLASFYYASSQYKEALQLLQQVEFTDSAYHLGAKITQLKSYYALQEWEAALSLLEAFRQLVQRQQALSDYRKQSNLNMIKLAKKLIKFKQQAPYRSPSKNKQALNSIQKALQKYQPLANLDWIEEEIRELNSEY